MKKKLILFLFILINISVFAGTYSATYDSFFIKNDAKARAMGEAYTGIAGDIGSLLYNPAGMAQVAKPIFTLSGYRGIASTGLVYLSSIWPFPFGTLGAGITYLGVPTDDIYNSVGEVVDTVKNSDFNVIAGYAKNLPYQIFVGGNVKFLVKNQFSRSIAKFGFDLGVYYNKFFSKIGNWGIGLSLHDLMMMGNINIGVSLKLNSIPILFSNDVSYYFYGQIFEKIGAEYIWNKMISVRLGYKYGYELGALSAGLGLSYPILSGYKLQINYAFNPDFNSELGQIHSIDVSLSFDSFQQKKSIPKKKIVKSVSAEIIMTAFENKSGIEKFDILSNMIPNKLHKYFVEHKKDYHFTSVVELGKTTKQLQNTNSPFILAGYFQRKDSLLEVHSTIIDADSQQVLDENSVSVQLKKDMMNELTQEMVNHIVAFMKSSDKQNIIPQTKLSPDFVQFVDVGLENETFTVLPFKNGTGIEKLVPLSKGLAKQVLSSINKQKNKNFSLTPVTLSASAQITPFALAKQKGITYALYGKFELEDKNLKIFYVIFKIATKEKVLTGDFSIPISKGVTEKIGNKLAKIIIEKWKR